MLRLPFGTETLVAIGLLVAAPIVCRRRRWDCASGRRLLAGTFPLLTNLPLDAGDEHESRVAFVPWISGRASRLLTALARLAEEISCAPSR